MSGLTVEYETIERVAVLSMNRPDKFNCISTRLLAGLARGLEEAEADDNVRVVLVRANGPHFCTGADLDEVRSHSRTESALHEFIGEGHAVMRRLEQSDLPVIAAVRGYCLAGGLELMMCADVVIAADDARMGCQHVRYGLVPGWGGTQRLPRLVGLRRALDLMYSGRWLEAREAFDWGLVNRVVKSAELETEALTYARELSNRNPEGIAAMKRLAREGLERSLNEALAQEQQVAVPALRSDNVAEGLRAFRERREPVFK